MADPHIQSPMDGWDIAGVIVYRSGFFLASIAFILFPWYVDLSRLGIMVAAALTASSLHIYMKSIRTILQYAAWLGLIFALLGWPVFGLGWSLVTLGGLAYKENFCFNIPGLNLQPVICALLWLSIALNWSLISHVLAVLSAILFTILSIKKARMPLHFDIGDKSKYEK
ncbi:MAG: hypothetical protein CSA47_01040 [Gammaproteobacteria bacterium]|nr:MAG: hypothetical protein CSA47_01040 [Gammaproteobacteria bacterium]